MRFLQSRYLLNGLQRSGRNIVAWVPGDCDDVRPGRMPEVALPVVRTCFHPSASTIFTDREPLPPIVATMWRERDLQQIPASQVSASALYHSLLGLARAGGPGTELCTSGRPYTRSADEKSPCAVCHSLEAKARVRFLRFFFECFPRAQAVRGIRSSRYFCARFTLSRRNEPYSDSSRVPAANSRTARAASSSLATKR